MTTTTTTECAYLGTASTPCGCATVLGRSYCAEHVHIVYQQGTARARRKKDLRIANSTWDLESEFNAAVEELIAEGYNFDEPRWEHEEVEEA